MFKIIFLTLLVFVLFTFAKINSEIDTPQMISASVDSLILEGKIPASLAGCDIKKISYVGDEGALLIKYDIYAGGNKIMDIQPQYNESGVTDWIGEITIFSDKYRIEKEIGPGSSLESLVKAYPDHSLGFIYISQKYVLIIDDFPDMQFFLSPDDFIGKLAPIESDWIDLSPANFKTDAKIVAIRIYLPEYKQQKDGVTISEEEALTILINALDDKMNGMSIRFDGEDVISSGVHCLTFSLGVNSAERFTVEEHFAVTEDGKVYRLDIIENEYILYNK